VVPLAITLELDELGGWVFVSQWIDVDVRFEGEPQSGLRLSIDVVPKTELTRCSLS
jgi:hypothetical protein